MPILAYCIIEENASIDFPSSGVQGRETFCISESGLQCLCSEFVTAGHDEPLRESALIFNKVLQSVFKQTTLIPFRFPTVVGAEQEIRGYLREQGTDLRNALKRFNGVVQMEVHLQFNELSIPQDSSSGADFLRRRKAALTVVEEASSQLREAVAGSVREWRIRNSANRARCYVLVERVAVEEFLQKASSVELPNQIRARITGPWPVSEFVSNLDRK